MNCQWTCLALVAVGIVALGSIDIDAAESELGTPAANRLERLKPSQLLLQPPEGLPGGFQLARTAPDVEFAVLPGQFSGARLWSSWGDALAASDGRFYAAIGDHDAPHGTAFVYCIDPKQKTVTRVIDCNQVVPVPADRYSPGKIHAPLVEADDGGIYMFGYRGSERQTGSETGYRGDWLLRYRPATGQTENLGMPVPFSSVPVLEYCQLTACLYGLSVPGQTMPEPRTQFFRYDLKTGRVTFACEVEAKGPRAIIVARDGRVYFGGGDASSGEPCLKRYDPQNDRVTQLAIRVPGDGMLRAASRADAEGVVYGISKDGVVFAFDTNTETVTEIAKAFVAGRLYTAVCCLDPTDTYLYYIPGAHGRSSETGTPVIQLNVKTGRPKVLAFLNETLRQQRNYNLGGTFGIALSADGSQLFASFNGAELPVGKQSEFGLCSALLLHIPENERNGQ
jgi:outer membrane protein assembly factor BamB